MTPAAAFPMQTGNLTASTSGGLTPEPHRPRNFAFGLTTFKEHGFGAFVRLRASHVAFDVSYGFMPVLVLYQTPSDKTFDMKADMSTIHASGSALFFFGDDQKRFQNGLRLGGIYDNIMGPGAMVGWVGDLVWNSFALGLGAGIQVYPDFVNQVSKHFKLTKGELADGGLNVIQPYFGLNLYWYAG